MAARNPYLPEGPDPYVCDQFMGISTATTRPGVDDKKLWWLDGFYPLEPFNCRTMYGVGPALITVTTPGNSISFYSFANVGSTPYCIVFLSNGGIAAVNTQTGLLNQFGPPGTVQNPSQTTVSISQYGNQYIIIVCQQTNGYFLWDGNVFYQAGSIGPVITLTNVGSGYTSAPSVSISGGSGSGTVLTATVANGVITTIVVNNAGSGYKAGDSITVVISGGGGSSGAATATLMPFAIAGNSVETYAGHVWVANNNKILFSAPGSVTDFATSDGGGSFTSSDSFLRVKYVSLLQTNGFLYLVGDSSENYISNVNATTSMGVTTTTFTNQNADPEVGSPWPNTVDIWGQSIILSNTWGVHISYGSRITKISEDLDGIFNSATTTFSGFIPSSAKAHMFGKKVFMVLIPLIDSISGQQVNKLCLWDGKKWWTSAQDQTLVYVDYQEINSVMTAYGTDGHTIWPLFQQPSAALTKSLQTRLWQNDIRVEKALTRFWALFQYRSTINPNITITLDNENGQGPPQVLTITSAAIPVINSLGATIPTVNIFGTVIPVEGAQGYTVLPPTSIGQTGVITGLTVQTNCPDMAIISLMLQPEIVGYRG